MSCCNSINLYNASVLETFEALEKDNLAPELAVWRDQKLVIYSQRTTTLIEKIVQFFKDCFFWVANKLGVLKLDPERVKKLKEDVYNFFKSKFTQDEYNFFQTALIEKKAELEAYDAPLQLTKFQLAELKYLEKMSKSFHYETPYNTWKTYKSYSTPQIYHSSFDPYEVEYKPSPQLDSVPGQTFYDDVD